MSKPYYKCNAVSSSQKSSEEELSLSYYVYIVIIVAITGIINKSLSQQQPEIKHKTIILAGLSFLLFIILILWMVGSIRSEGFKGRRKRKQTRLPAVAPTKKTNLSPTLLAVLPIMALALLATIGHVIYKSL